MDLTFGANSTLMKQILPAENCVTSPELLKNILHRENLIWDIK